MRVDWCTRQSGEAFIARKGPGWDRLFACWDTAHEPDEPHFHLAAKRQPDWQRSFHAMSYYGSSGAASVAYGHLRMAAPTRTGR